MKPHTERLSIRLPVDTLDILDQKSKDLGIDRSKALRMAIEEFIGQSEEEWTSRKLSVGIPDALVERMDELVALGEEQTREEIIRSALKAYLGQIRKEYDGWDETMERRRERRLQSRGRLVSRVPA